MNCFSDTSAFGPWRRMSDFNSCHESSKPPPTKPIRSSPESSNQRSGPAPIRQWLTEACTADFPPTGSIVYFPHLKDVSVPENYATFSYKNTRSENELIQSMRRAEFYGMMQKTLRKVDLASMGVSLEVRVPFLKKSFIESVSKLDPMLSYGPNRKKQLLKNHLSKLVSARRQSKIKNAALQFHSEKF